MTREEAVKVLSNNYPDSRYTMLKEAVDTAIASLHEVGNKPYLDRENVKFQVALSCIQGVLEAKHGILGEIAPSLAVAESLRIADEFVKQWFKDEEKI